MVGCDAVVVGAAVLVVVVVAAAVDVVDFVVVVSAAVVVVSVKVLVDVPPMTCIITVKRGKFKKLKSFRKFPSCTKQLKRYSYFL